MTTHTPPPERRRCARCKDFHVMAEGVIACRECIKVLEYDYNQIDITAKLARDNAYKRWINFPPVRQ
jgi:hypothetical protein